MAVIYCLEGLEDLLSFVRSDLRKNLSLDEIRNLLSEVTVRPEDFVPYVIPDTEHYHRERLEQTEFASLYVLTWLPGQASPIHDHRESQCGVRVVAGEMTEVFYEPVAGAEDQARRTAVNIWQPGVITSSEQGIGIHKVANETREETLVTLHLYSPPLLNMKMYTETD